MTAHPPRSTTAQRWGSTRKLVINIEGPTHHELQAKLLLRSATASITKLCSALCVAQQCIDRIGERSRVRRRDGQACDSVGRDKRDTRIQKSVHHRLATRHSLELHDSESLA